MPAFNALGDLPDARPLQLTAELYLTSSFLYLSKAFDYFEAL